MSLHQMHDHLWQGSVVESLDFTADVVVTCSPESEVSIVRPRKLHILLPFADEAVLPDMVLLDRTAEYVAHLVALGYDALIHCTAGKNRSGLMVALTLQHLGVATGQALVDYVRARNPDAFTEPGSGGPYFAQHLATGNLNP